MEFGDMLKTIRKERGLTQDELASILGTTKQVISRYETKQRVPRLSVVEDYAAKLCVPLSSSLAWKVLSLHLSQATLLLCFQR